MSASGARERLTSEAMRPAAATERWAQRIDSAERDAALGPVAMIEAANAEDEALAVAVALREAVHEGKTAALVTPDRALARRVAANLERWNIAADDSGGDALPDTEAGVFARLAAEAALEGLPPVKLLALCKHARFRLGAAAGAHVHAIAALEMAVLRGPRPREGSVGLVQALATFRATKNDLYRSDPRRKIRDADLDTAQELAARLAAALVPLEQTSSRSFTSIAAQHAEVLRALSTDEAGNAAVYAGDDGTALALAFEDIAAQGGDLRVDPSDYSELFETAIADRVCRRAGTAGRARAHSRHHRSAARSRRPRGARRTGRDRMAAGDAHRSVAVAPDAARSRPRPARAARRPLGA